MANRNWNLETFLDHFILELDKARDTLSVKGINKPLTYAVKDVSLDLQIFPEFSGDEVLFKTAKSGETGASKLSIQLGSITDRQIRQTTKEPLKEEDIAIDLLDEVDADVKKDLQKIGVTSSRDIENLEKRNINLADVSKGRFKNTYQELAGKLKQLKNIRQRHSRAKSQQLKRSEFPPEIKQVTLNKAEAGLVNMAIKGKNLAMVPSFQTMAFVNDSPVKILYKDAQSMKIQLNVDLLQSRGSEVKLILDPYTIVRFELK